MVFRKVVTDVSKDLVAFDEAIQVQFEDDDGCITVHRNIGKSSSKFIVSHSRRLECPRPEVLKNVSIRGTVELL
jgi:hypothetical protein